MNTDEQLRHLLTTAAESYEPPADGATRVIARARQEFSPKSRRRMPRPQMPRPQMPRPRTLRWAGLAALCAVLVAAVGLGIANTGRSSTSTSSPTRAPQAAVDAPNTASLPSAAPAQSPATANSAPVPARSARIVQIGQVSLEVQHGQVRSALDRLGAIATGAGGFLSQTQDDEGDGTPSGTSTLRVPVAQFSAVLAQVRKVGRVTSSSTSARDVTSDYVDLAARINALQQTRATYLTLLSRATTIGDTLMVQQQVQQVQTQIEQLQGQQKVLADQSDLATLAVSVSEAGAAPPPVAKSTSTSGFSHAWHRAIAGFNDGLQTIITIAGPLLLALIILGLFAWLGRRGYRLVRRWQA